jgi:hypothetical protein
MSKNPVVILFKSKSCGACKMFEKIWPKTQEEMRKVNPNTKFIVIPDLNFDENVFPKNIKKVIAFFPSLILTREDVWEESLKHLGPTNTFSFEGKVQIMNKMYRNENGWKQEYAFMNPEESGRWLRESMQNPIFNSLVVSTKENEQTKPNSQEIKKNSVNNICTMNIKSRYK